MVRRGDMLSVADVQDSPGIDLVGVVERDESIIVAANTGEPVTYNQKARAGQAFNRIAARLCGESVAFPNFGGRSLWGKLTRTLGVAS